MINWRDCIVPASDKPAFVYVAYSKTFPYLPFALADSCSQLERVIGLRHGAVGGYITKYNDGKIKHNHPRYAKVYIGGPTE